MATTILFIMLLATLIIFVFTRVAAESLVTTHHQQKTSFFQHYPVKPGDRVFLGDSITDFARWDELFPGRPVKNRGISADTVSGVLNRLEDVTKGHPAAIFLLIGTNNLPWYAYQNDQAILNTYEAILNRCKKVAPSTQVFVQSILPRSRSFAKRIRSLNTALAALAAHYDYPFIDLYPHFAGQDGEIHPEFSNDKLHLLAPGYAKWVEILTSYTDSLAG